MIAGKTGPLQVLLHLVGRLASIREETIAGRLCAEDGSKPGVRTGAQKEIFSPLLWTERPPHRRRNLLSKVFDQLVK